MLKMLTDLINEHGSSTILKERLQLVSDRYDHLEERAGQLEARNKELEADLKRARDRISDLEKLVAENQNSPQPSDINEDTQKILKLLFSSDSIDPLSIAHQISINKGVAEYHLNELRDRDFARVVSMTPDCVFTGSKGSINWAITPAGRKYVVEVLGT